MNIHEYRLGATDWCSAADHVLDPDGRYVEVSDAFCDLMGLSREQLLGAHYQDFLVEPAWTHIARHIDDVLRGEPRFFQVTLLNASGERLPLLNAALPLLDDNGARGVRLLARDISEQVASAEQLHIATSALNHTSEAVMVLDRQGRVVLTNAIYTTLTGYTADAVFGKRPLPDTDKPDQRLLDRVKQAIHRDGAWQNETHIRHRDGHPFPALVRMRALHDRNHQITHYLLLFRDISSRLQLEQRVQYLSHYDELTGLANRTLLRAQCVAAITRARRHRDYVALLFLDLDRFKQINDSLGHQVGDELLVKCGERLQETLRDSDIVARLGGDEFGILLDELDKPEVAGAVATKLLEAFHQPFELAGRQVYTTPTIGIACFPSDGEDFDALLHTADLAMYGAKQDGRNTFRYFSGELNLHAVRTLTLQTALHRAIDNNEFQLHYQPIVELATGRISGVEALIRWYTPELGVVAPGEFIPVAEETGLILPIGEWVLGEAIRETQKMICEDPARPPLRVAVNLSPRQFLEHHLVERITALLREAQLPAENLVLELTETMVMDHLEDTIPLMKALRQQDIRVALDDFGTGFSSLKYLQDFHLHYLKIDKSFVDGIPHDPKSTAIVRTIIAMARSLDLRLIAEGVETREQLDTLRAWGCEEAQGYFLSMPLQAQDLRWLLDNHPRLPVEDRLANGDQT